TTEGIRVLHMLFVLCDELAFSEQCQDLFCHLKLPGLRPDGVYVRKKRFFASVKYIQRKGADNVTQPEEPVRVKCTPYAVRAHELGAVQKRQPFLCPEANSCPVVF